MKAITLPAARLAEPPAGAATTAAAGTSSAQEQALLALRAMILSGDLPGGARLTELAIVERLGVSRTPVRAALLRLEQEGLLEALPSGGYAVHSFSERDVADAIELRGTLEGVLARLAAERGAAGVPLAEARAVLAQIDALLCQPALDGAAFAQYVALNQRFHALLAELAASPVIERQLERVTALPFASASAFVIAQAESPQARDMLVVAQDQHRQVLDAVERREGARAEALMREHSRLAQRNLRAVLAGERGADAIDGMRLIRRR